ncbi:unnamed protein product, partial [Larinioides sclopetarius]
MRPKRPSGSKFRKIKRHKGEENKKLASALGNWLINEEEEEQSIVESDKTNNIMLHYRSETILE